MGIMEGLKYIYHRMEMAPQADISGSWQGQNFISASQTFLSTGQRSGNSVITGSLFLVGSSGHLTASGNISASGTGSFGRVGIGTASPSAKLHVDGDALITGKITAQEFHTEFVSASIIYQSGSTKFGDTSDDVHG
jgi:hypothetical protein